MTGAHHGYNGVPATQLPPRPSVQVSGVPGSTAPADEATLKRVKEDLLKEKQDKKKDKNGVLRTAAGARWWDPTLAEWSENDFRIFVGDLGNEVNDDALGKAFSRYPSFAKAKVCQRTDPTSPHQQSGVAHNSSCNTLHGSLVQHWLDLFVYVQLSFNATSK